MGKFEQVVRFFEVLGIVVSMGLGAWGVKQALETSQREETNLRLAAEAAEREKENLRIATENAQLEKENLRIAAETAERGKANWLISVRPNLGSTMGLSEGTIHLKNRGLGPAEIYEIHLSGPKSKLVLTRGPTYLGNTSTQHEIETFIKENWPRQRSSIEIDYSGPLTTLAVGEELRFMLIRSATPLPRDEIVEFMESLDLLVCYTDIIGSRLPGSFNGDPGSINKFFCSNPPH